MDFFPFWHILSTLLESVNMSEYLQKLRPSPFSNNMSTISADHHAAILENTKPRQYWRTRDCPVKIITTRKVLSIKLVIIWTVTQTVHYAKSKSEDPQVCEFFQRIWGEFSVRRFVRVAGKFLNIVSKIRRSNRCSHSSHSDFDIFFQKVVEEF